jgi:hypothetical protein
MQNADLTGFLDSLDPEARKLVVALRRVVRRTVPAAEESLLWGGLSYHRPEVGGRVKGAVCQIGPNAAGCGWTSSTASA